MKVIIAPDSFKGSMLSTEAATAIEKGLKAGDPTIESVCIPMADGGEGTVDAILAITGGEKVACIVEDPIGRPVTATFGWISDRKTAVIETAAASGLPLLTPNERNPFIASTYGTGELVAAALDKGASTIIIGLGGSATVDAGSGFLQALGVRFLNEDGEELKAAGGHLGQINHIDYSGLDQRLQNTKVIVASDVTNPLLGDKGAIYVFGPQKGVTHDELERYEAGMKRYAEIVVETTNKNCVNSPGSGAAGGFGFSLLSFLQIEMESGFNLIADLANLKETMSSADLVITGEGNIDEQTLYGKVPAGIATIASQFDVPVCAFAGKIEGSVHFKEKGITLVLPIVDETMGLDDAIKNGALLLERASQRFIETMKLLKKVKRFL